MQTDLIEYYNTLNVTKNATKEDIKKNYYQLVRIYHPDRNPGNKQKLEKFKKIQEAYFVLKKNKENIKRELFDQGYSADKGLSKNFIRQKKEKTSRPFFKKKKIQNYFDKKKSSFAYVKPQSKLDNIATASIIERIKFSNNRYVKIEAVKILRERGSVYSLEGLIDCCFVYDKIVDKEIIESVDYILNKNGFRSIYRIWKSSNLLKKLKILNILKNTSNFDVIAVLDEFSGNEPLFLKLRLRRIKAKVKSNIRE